ncbi:MAG: cupin domain-containing protein [Alphaproteobacteria bacterium]
MSKRLAILDAMPSAPDFYGQYWNQRPFVVRGGIPEKDFDGLIAADELAGLSMEDAPQSRMVMTAGDPCQWSCRYGPFSARDFEQTGDVDWSLLVQNVEQFHPDTARLLRHFNFAPRWLMDDIMVSYSATGGSVGAHIDSYHVFLVQGQGRRRWKVGRAAIDDAVLIDGIDLKILDGGFDGDEVEVTRGDVLYVPPKFGHQGTTIDDAMTFSVGFLGPRLSELYGQYGEYLSEFEDADQRYVGDGLTPDSGGFTIAASAVDDIQDRLARRLTAKDFSRWLVTFFTESSHDDFGNYSERETPLSIEDLAAKLEKGDGLFKPEYVKLALTTSASGAVYLGFERHGLCLDDAVLPLIDKLMNGQAVTADDPPGLLDHPASLEFLLDLYNHYGLEIPPPTQRKS